MPLSRTCQSQTKAEESGILSLEAETLTYRSPTKNYWQISLSDVLIIAEETNENGPFTDD